MANFYTQQRQKKKQKPKKAAPKGSTTKQLYQRSFGMDLAQYAAGHDPWITDKAPPGSMLKL